MRRIALFQAHWPVQSQTVNAAIMLADAGYTVDLFLSKAPFYVEPSSLSRWETIRVHDLTTASGRLAQTHPTTAVSLLGRIRRRLRALLRAAKQAYWLWPPSRERILPRALLSQTLAVAGASEYSCLIGIEKLGLIWAGMVADLLGTPIVYYSLELYTKEHLGFSQLMGGPIYVRRLREVESRYHRQAAATIIQTPERARLLCEDTGAELSKERTYYVPVSVMGPARRRRSTLLHDALGLDRDRKLVLYFGIIGVERYALELARASQRFRDDWTLVLHGWGEAKLLEQIRRLDKENSVALSLEILSSDRIGDVIASAAVGVALYAPTPANDRLTAFASEKMALYMQQGVPFVSFDYAEYRELAERYQCGEVVSDVADLPKAVDTILGSHDEYRANAATAFADHYQFARNFESVIEGIEGLR